MVDLSAWLQPIDGPNPSGAGLRDEPLFSEIERLTEPQFRVVKDERNNVAASEPIPVDWSAVLSKAERLRQQGRDLRLLVLVVRALANQSGYAGLADGLTLVAQSIDGYWDSLHPELRPGPLPAGALRRTNALSQLDGDADGLLGDLRKAVVFSPRMIGPISGRDLERSMLDERAVLAEAPGLGNAERSALVAEHGQLLTRVRTGCAAFLEQSPSEFAAFAGDVRAALAALGAVETALGSRLGERLVTTPKLRAFLERVLAALERAAADPRSTAARPATDPPAAAPNGAANGFSHSAAAAAPVVEGRLPDRLQTRDDVVRCLDLVIGFYDRTEPSSPIPHLARRVRRMVHMDFIELMEDLAPAGLKEFRLLAGVPDAKKSAAKEER